MLSSRGRFQALIIGIGIASLLLQACERQPLVPLTPVDRSPAAPSDSGATFKLAEVACTGSRTSAEITCAPGGNVLGDIVMGNQNTYVRLVSSGVNYETGTQKFTFNLTIRNLIPQAIGTLDGTSVAPTGIRIFFNDGPNVTSGTGLIEVVPTGTAAFLGTDQAYYQYNQLLVQDATSTPVEWTLKMPLTVNTFSFSLYVSAPVRFPGGYVHMEAGRSVIRSDDLRQVTAVAKSAVGNNVPGQIIKWSSSDTTRAVVDANGLVGGVREGTVTIATYADTAPGDTIVYRGTFPMTITPIERFWKSDAASTAFETKGNWSRNVTPEPGDSLEIPLSANYPSLNANRQAAALTILSGASFSMNAFDLTLTKGFIANGPFTATTGRVLLTGVAQTISATNQVPRLRVTSTGSYNLGTNVSVKNIIQIDGGRLTVEKLRLQVSSEP